MSVSSSLSQYRYKKSQLSYANPNSRIQFTLSHPIFITSFRVLFTLLGDLTIEVLSYSYVVM